jgi:serine protease AprX
MASMTTNQFSGTDTRRGPTVVIALIALFASLFAATGSLPAASTGNMVDVIVRETQPDTATAETLVERLGGAVVDQLSIIGGFTATVPADVLGAINAHASIQSATADTTLTPKWGDDHDNEWSGWSDDRGTSLDDVTDTIEANTYWRSYVRGDGVDVALIDTGVSPVDALDQSYKIVNGADFSLESQDPNTRFLDTNGHGTHMAAIIAGYDRGFKGVAYKSRIVNVKVGSNDGSVDVSQVIAAIDWVVANKNSNGMNIRVLNLSYGTDSTQDPRVDPLSYAVERAWNSGIVVVVAAGNNGEGARLTNPATNPYVIAVGATDIKGNDRSWDDEVAAFSSCGVGRTVDLVAPGKSIESARVPNSSSDVDHPEARVGSELFKGSGTSQAAAVVSGAAALIIDDRPSITPDELKALLMETADDVDGSSACTGAGQIDLGHAKYQRTPRASQEFPEAEGTGSLEASRGSYHLMMDDVPLVGEQDIMGDPFTGTSWSGLSWSGLSWSGTSWSGLSWSGLSWSGLSWTGTSWSGTSWSGTSWSTSGWASSAWLSAGWGNATQGLRWD